MNIKVIIFGATGMVGEGVLHEAIKSSDVESILIVGRRSSNVTNSKVTEIIHKDFFNYSSIEDKLKGYNACFFCLGVTSIGKKEEEYTKLTYDLTIAAAKLLSGLNPEMTFCYVSGEGTDSTENGNRMWARVKGKTENDLINLPFKKVFNFRPGYIRPINGLKNALFLSRVFSPLYPLMKIFLSKHICTLKELALAMIYVSKYGYSKNILENLDIHQASKMLIEKN